MQDHAELIDKARALGEALARNPRVREHAAAQKAVRASVESQRLLREYQQHVEHVHELEAAQRPIEVADKRKLADFEQKMAGDEALKRLMRAQADYVELMNQVNQAMDAPLAELNRPGAPA